jgi:group I intron endonuclease
MFIYKITNKINGKIYIGQTTKSIERRFIQHKTSARNKSISTPLTNAIKKYGEENFIIEQIDTANDIEKLNEKEIYWINILKSKDRSIGYNLKDGGLNGIHSEESILKMSTPVLKYNKDGTFIEEYQSLKSAAAKNNTNHGGISSCCSGKIKSAAGYVWLYKKGDFIAQKIEPYKEHDRTHTEATKEKQRQWHIGKKYSDETKQKISNTKKQKKLQNPNYGLPKDPEARSKKLSIALKGKKRTPEQNEANRKRNLGKKASEETKQKQRDRMTGMKLSEEWKKNIGLGNLGKKNSEESKQKVSITKKMNGDSVGTKNPMYGKSVYDVWVEKYGIEKANELSEQQKKKQADKMKQLQKKNPNAYGAKQVLKYDMDDNFIKEYVSCAEAAMDNATKASAISACCLGKRISHHNFKYKYKESNK